MNLIAIILDGHLSLALEDTHDDLPPPTDARSSSVDLLPYSPHIKLPKLLLKKFSGELTRWMTFWNTFKSAVHKNPVLTNIDKFSYLNLLLESTASETLPGLTLTSSNYNGEVATLK